MIKTIFRVAILALLALNLNAASLLVKTDFSGTWTLDKAKSEGLPPSMEQTVTVTQKDDKITVETKSVTDKGEQTSSDSYTVDGKETEYTPKVPNNVTNAKAKRSVKWTTDGFEVLETITGDTPTGAVTVVTMRKWSLSADGKTLKIDLTQKLPDGTREIKRTFTKK
ncbi:MAG TPA: hypothetical protein VF692_08500 [Pyrinomonadaceae bacterium]|jgi:hypothetical protein